MMDTLAQIGSIAALGSLILSRPATLSRDLGTHPVRASRMKSNKPYRANENRKPFDAQFRIDGKTSPVEPQQNDLLLMDGEEWIVWRISQSPAQSHWIVECMAPSTIAIVPVQRTKVDDGIGGETYGWTEVVDSIFYAKLREASVDRQLTAGTESSMGRLSMAYRADTAPAGFDESWRVRVSNGDLPYEILSITTDDENPFWRNAILSRESAVRIEVAP